LTGRRLTCGKIPERRVLGSALWRGRAKTRQRMGRIIAPSRPITLVLEDSDQHLMLPIVPLGFCPVVLVVLRPARPAVVSRPDTSQHIVRLPCASGGAKSRILPQLDPLLPLLIDRPAILPSPIRTASLRLTIVDISLAVRSPLLHRLLLCVHSYDRLC
jgi:hypothetical protein